MKELEVKVYSNSNRAEGQGVLEAILILALFLVVSTLVAGEFRKNDLLSEMVSSPWKKIAGMLQNGVWMNPDEGASYHPSHHARHVSNRGDKLE